MQDKEQSNQAEGSVLTEESMNQVSGGHSHPGSTVFRARRPIGGLSSYTCEKCGLTLPDAGSYYEHRKMAHGE